jgi:hypothetical protein
MHCGKISLFFLISMLEYQTHHEFFAYDVSWSAVERNWTPERFLERIFGGLENRPNCIYIEKISHLSNFFI